MVTFSIRTTVLLSCVILCTPELIWAAAEEPACADKDLAIAQAMMADVKKAINEAITGLEKNTPSAVNNAITWLGARSSSDSAEVKKVLTRMLVYTNGVNFRCAVYAYVRPDKSFAIVLGAFFFTAPDTGFDSKVGVIVHELSHFTLVGATKDTVYGREKAKALAIQNPSVAQHTADNYEYFVEGVAFGQ